MGTEAVRAALLLVAALALFQAVPLVGARDPGRELVAEHELPAEQVARYRAQAETAAAAPAATRAWTEPHPWLGPRQATGIGRNPYTLVLRVGGVATAAGDVRTHWHAGWDVQESPSASRELMLPVAALSSGSVRAGMPLTLTAVGTPVSFRGERSAAPMLSLVTAHNFEIRSVRMAVWSGPAPWLSIVPMTTAHTVCLALALLCALAWWALRRPTLARRDPAAAASSAMATSTLPPLATLPPALPSSPASLAPASPPALPAPGATHIPAVTAAPPVAPAPTVTPATQAARVVTALGEVLGSGLTVVTEFDESRRRRRRRRGLHAG